MEKPKQQQLFTYTLQFCSKFNMRICQVPQTELCSERRNIIKSKIDVSAEVN